MNDDNEVIKLSCTKCKQEKEGTYQELFGSIPSLLCLPKMLCKCGGDIRVEMTGQYK